MNNNRSERAVEQIRDLLIEQGKVDAQGITNPTELAQAIAAIRPTSAEAATVLLEDGYTPRLVVQAIKNNSGRECAKFDAALRAIAGESSHDQRDHAKKPAGVVADLNNRKSKERSVTEQQLRQSAADEYQTFVNTIRYGDRADTSAGSVEQLALRLTESYKEPVTELREITEFSAAATLRAQAKRIAELEAALDSEHAKVGHNIWRFWSEKAREMAGQLDDAQKRIAELKTSAITYRDALPPAAENAAKGARADALREALAILRKYRLPHSGDASATAYNDAIDEVTQEIAALIEGKNMTDKVQVKALADGVDISPESVERFLEAAHSRGYRPGHHEDQKVVEYLRAQAKQIAELKKENRELALECLTAHSQAEEAVDELAKARADALREVMTKCNAVLSNDRSGSGTAYDNGYKFAAQCCVDEIESMIEGESHE